MMPTFPPLSLKFRKAGFPRYGFKAGLSGGAFPSTASSSRRAVCFRPSCTSLPTSVYPVRSPAPWCAGAPPFKRQSPLYPRGPRSGPSYAVSVHHHLVGPIRPTRQHTATSPQSGLYAMPSLCALPLAPRRPTSGSGLSLSVPSLHVVLEDPGAPPTAPAQLFVDGCGLNPEEMGSAFCTNSQYPLKSVSRGGFNFGTTCFAFATTCKVACLPLTDPTHLGPTETFTPGLSTGRSPFPSPGMTTVVAGRLHRQDLHLLEHQLASLQLPFQAFPNAIAS